MSRAPDERREPRCHQPRATVRATWPPRCPRASRSARAFNPALARASGRDGRSRGAQYEASTSCWLAASTSREIHATDVTSSIYPRIRSLSAVLAAESINGIQGEGVISTIKHYSLNCNETNRHWLDAIIDPAAHRESDLLAFEIAIERSQPGSVMTGYNKINGDYAGGNAVPARGRAQGRVGLPGMGDVRLGRHPELGVRAQGARPGVAVSRST